ncbi:MAG: phage tail tape measure protein [Rhizobiaceae bacterium]|nr:phage tail tape measure protein [Rhizobiaceae bacterium]
MAERREIAFDVSVDTRPFEAAMRQMEDLSRTFGSSFSSMLRGAVTSGNELETTLRRIGLRIADMALRQGLSPLKGMLGPTLGGLRGGLPSMLGFANGGVPGRVTPFADGGVVSTPTFFPSGRQLGLMGEAGAEAILPLARGADGKLGVAAAGGGGGVSIVFNVSAPDAASFRKSEAQLTGMLARAVSRGTRTL